MRIKRSEIIDVLIWVLVGFYTLIAHWIWFGRGIQETVIVSLMLIQVLRNLNWKRQNVGSILLPFVVIVYFIYSSIKSSSRAYLLQDVKSIMGGMISMYYLYSFWRNDNGKCIRFITKSCDILKGYMWINSVIILIQYIVPYFLMNRTAINIINNSAYFDQLTGLIGINGTTRWNTLSCITIITYLNSAKSKRDYWKTGAFILLSIIISMLNSARAFLLMLPLMLILYYLIVVSKTPKRVVKISAIIIGVTTLGYLIYKTNSYVNYYINDLIEDKFAIYNSRDLAYMVRANDDRAVAINYAIINGGWSGKGLGSIPMHFANEYVKYLGINSTSSFVYMLGGVGYLLVTAVFSVITALIVDEAHRLIRFIEILLFWLIASYLLPVYSSIVMMFCLSMIMIIMGAAVRKQRI